MNINGNNADGVKIAYIGGGSRGWAWCLMSDLAASKSMSGDVYLYDIDYEAANNNKIIGNKFTTAKGASSAWHYHATKTIEESLSGADFVIISILPGTFREMESDVHTPEKYGIYQPVGDTTGPGGIIRAMRTVPMFEFIAEKIRECCPSAWVINYTNPMSICVGALYRAFPEIKAIGCCHEVFGTQKLLCDVLRDIEGIDCKHRRDIKVSVTGVNHFTWLTEAKYGDLDIFPIYKKFCEKYRESGYIRNKTESQLAWDEQTGNVWVHRDKVKIDLFNRYGYIAAAGDRHLAEFCPGDWYLKSPEVVREKYYFNLTPVSYRWKDLEDRLKKSRKYLSGEIEPKVSDTGEEGVMMMESLLGFGDIVTNVNLPNRGQISNLPLGAIVETNALFSTDSVVPCDAGNVPNEIYALIARIVGEQECVLDGIFERNTDKIFGAFANNPLVRLPLDDARALFDEMISNTKEYLTMYNVK